MGAMKAGTTSLFDYLASDPRVWASSVKEIHHFDGTSGPGDPVLRGWGWYRSHFPTRTALRAAQAITGEATPCYMFNPTAPPRIARALPSAQWIVVLRDPVERCVSHLAMTRSSLRGSIAESIELDLDQLVSGMPSDVRFDDDRWTYTGGLVGRGHYVEQLEVLAGLRPDRPTLVLFSENLFAADPESFFLLHDVLGLPDPRPEEFPHLNPAASAIDVGSDLRRRLDAHYATVNAGLGELLRTDRFVTTDPDRWPTWVERRRPTEGGSVPSR